MKYIVRFIGATVLWPLLVVYLLIGCLIVNTLSILWHLNFKHLWILEKNDFYFYIERNGSEISDIDIKNGICEWESYNRFYKNPLDMIRGNITKEII